MWILKTFRDYKQIYLECGYRNQCPTYLLAAREMDMWYSSMSEEVRTYIPIGYIYENT